VDQEQTLIELHEQAANLRPAQRLLGIGIWKLDLDSMRLTWSDNLYDMYGVGRDEFGHDFNSYVALVHPDDREQMQLHYAAFADSDSKHFNFEHRILRPDGSVVHVRGVGEITEGRTGNVLTGVVQDISSQVRNQKTMDEAINLVRIAGEMALVGGWRVDLEQGIVYWSDVVATIHDEPDLSEVPVEKASTTMHRSFGIAFAKSLAPVSTRASPTMKFCSS